MFFVSTNLTLTESIMSKKEEIRKELKSFDCLHCGAKFTLSQSMNRHIAAVHEGKKPFKCDTCGACFAHKPTLKGHIATVHEEKKQFTCSFCNSNYAYKANLYTHIVAIHEGEKPYKCSICEYSCTKEDLLKIHISSVHEEKESYEFTVLHSNYDFNGYVQTVPESMKLFKCPFCSIKSPKQSNINKHVKKVHEKENVLKGEKEVRDEKRKAIDDKLLDPNAFEAASKKGRLEAGPSTVQTGPNSVETHRTF